jgi:hypothetical protein
VNPKVRRVELHEITRGEFSKKYNDPRDFNEMLVKAQIVRRVQDRWVGFELSKKVQSKFKKSGLSAGRVQSTVLGWIVEREEEYKKSERIFSKVEFDGRTLEIEGKIDEKKIVVEEINEFVKQADSIVTGSEMRHLGKIVKNEIREAFFSSLPEIKWHGTEAETYEGWFNGEIAVILSWSLAIKIDKILKEKGIRIVDNSYNSKMKVHALNYLIAEALDGILLEEWKNVKADDLKLFDAIIGKTKFKAVFAFKPKNMEIPKTPMKITLLQR